MFGFSRKKPDPPKTSQPPPLPNSPAASQQVNPPGTNPLDTALAALQAGPWVPHTLISALTLSEVYLLLETPSDPDSFLILVGEDETPIIALFSAESHTAAARERDPAFTHLHKINPRKFIMSLNDGVGFAINPFSPGFDYHAGARHTAAIRNLFLGR